MSDLYKCRKQIRNVLIFACSQLCLVAFNHIGDASGINVVMVSILSLNLNIDSWMLG